MLRFFTREWREGRGLPFPGDRLLALYDEYLASLTPPLPGHIRELALNVDLHDAFLHGLRRDADSTELGLLLRAGDLQRGYFDVKLSYGAAALNRGSAAIFQRALRSRDELLDHELDTAPLGKWLHRFLFHEAGEATIVFEQLTWDLTPKNGRFDGTAA